MKRTEYIRIAKAIRNAEIPSHHRDTIIREIVTAIYESTPLFDEKAFRNVANIDDYLDAYAERGYQTKEMFSGKVRRAD
jgi:type II restriction/modification system DNA methylase subunit YeeA